MKKALLILIVIILLGLTACAQPVSGDVLKSEKPRVTSPQVSPADLSTQVDGNSQFAFDLYQALRDKDGNLFYSPHSISLALAMTYVGARGETEQQMADTLWFGIPQESLHKTLNGLDIELASRG